MSENTKKCPFCAEVIHTDAIKCKFCHEMLSPRSSAIPSIIKSLKRLAICLLIGALAVFLLGWLYFWIMEIPIVFIIVPIGYGLVAGAISFFSLKFSNRNISKKAYLSIVIAMGLIAVYGNWVWTINHYYRDAFTLNPLSLFEYIEHFSGVQKITLNRMITVRGMGIVTAWIIEALMIMGGTLVAGMVIKSRSFFCSDCERWSITFFESPPLLFEPELNDDMIATMKTHDYSPLNNAKTGNPKEHHYKVTIIYCPTCRRGILDLTANIVTEEKELLTQNFKLALKKVPTGKFKTDAKFIVQNLPCSTEETDRLIGILSKVSSSST